MKLILLSLELPPVSWTGIVIFVVGAAILAIAVRFFVKSKQSITLPKDYNDPHTLSEADEWRLKYYESLDMHEKKVNELEDTIREAYQRENSIREEVVKVRLQMEQMEEEYENGKEPLDYLGHLEKAHKNLETHHHQIQLLMAQLEKHKGTELQLLSTLRENEQLNQEMRKLQTMIVRKEEELQELRHQNTLAIEKTERLSKAYVEIKELQDKIRQLGEHMGGKNHSEYEFEEMQQSLFKLTKNSDELRMKQINLLEENQRLTRLVADVEDKLRESNFQRHQLAKKVGYLERLNNDLQIVAAQNNKLDNQLKRISEIDQILSEITQQKKPNS